MIISISEQLFRNILIPILSKRLVLRNVNFALAHVYKLTNARTKAFGGRCRWINSALKLIADN